MIRVFAIPALIAVLTMAGLMSALLVEEIGPPLSWLALSMQLLVLGWYGGRFFVMRRR